MAAYFDAWQSCNAFEVAQHELCSPFESSGRTLFTGSLDDGSRRVVTDEKSKFSAFGRLAPDNGK